MLKFILVLLLANISGSAEAAFTCEEIKNNATRASCIEDRTEKEKSGAMTQQLDQYQAFITEAKAYLTRDFKDPGSVQWRDIYIGGSGSEWYLCGEENAKNSYGAYTGFRHFVFSSGSNSVGLAMREDDELREFFPRMWLKACSEIIYKIPAEAK